jgi:hypothetical protein
MRPILSENNEYLSDQTVSVNFKEVSDIIADFHFGYGTGREPDPEGVFRAAGVALAGFVPGRVQ